MPTSGGQKRPDIYRAIARRGKLLIAEGVYPPRIDQSDIGRGAAANDVNMLVCPVAGSALAEFRSLQASAGFKPTRIIPTPARLSVIKAERV
jgi:hypothetical protein